MGILKNIANFVTGGAADVSLILENDVIREGESIKATLTITAKEETIISKLIYVKVEAIEQSENKRTLYERQHELDTDIQINASESKSWPVQIELPEDAPATYLGKHSKMEWHIAGG